MLNVSIDISRVDRSIKEIVTKMGGQISLKSELEKGSEFIIEIPFEIAPFVSSEAKEFTYVDLSEINILIVEDNQVNVIYMEAVLEKMNAKVDVARDGLQAISLCEKNVYDMILMDLQMPNLDGVSATAHLRQILKIPTPIIAQSANTVQKEIEDCYNAGVNDFIAKPFTIEQLLSKIVFNLNSNSDLQIKKKASIANNKVKTDTTNKTMYEKALEIVGFDESTAHQILEVFKTESIKDLGILKTAIDNQDRKAVNQTGHKIKSSFKYFKMNEAAEISLYFETVKDMIQEKKDINSKFKQLKNLLFICLEEIE